MISALSLIVFILHFSRVLSTPFSDFASRQANLGFNQTNGLANGNVGAAASSEPPLANFGDTVNILGAMERTDQDFRDGLALDLFSPKNRTLVVQRNNAPLPGNFVTGSTGEPFIALQTFSYQIRLNETANDLIAKVELPYDRNTLRRLGILQSNTYVGKLAVDGRSWVVSETQRNVHISESKTRIIKLTSLDGEYILLGRKTVDTANIFVQYGQGATRTVNVTGGPGTQEAEFVDGLRFTVNSQQAFGINADLKNNVASEALPQGAFSINSFSWVVNTSMPAGAIRNAELRVPVNRAILAAKIPNVANPEQRVMVARRSLGSTSTTIFAPMQPGAQEMVASEDRIRIGGLTQLDGEYILLGF